MLHLFLLQGGLVNVLGTMESRYIIDDVVGLFYFAGSNSWLLQ